MVRTAGIVRSVDLFLSEDPLAANAESRSSGEMPSLSELASIERRPH